MLVPHDVTSTFLFDVLKNNLEEEDSQMVGNGFRLLTVDLHEYFDVLLEGHEGSLEIVHLAGVVIDFVEFLAVLYEVIVDEVNEGHIAPQPVRYCLQP